jgi:hypothetical protein
MEYPAYMFILIKDLTGYLNANVVGSRAAVVSSQFCLCIKVWNRTYVDEIPIGHACEY